MITFDHREKKTGRLLSLDVFRGMTIVGMILVNSPGNNTAYSWLEHSQWNGCTFADLVFPFFLFIVGVSLAYAFSKRLEFGGITPQLFVKIVQRTCIIFILGLILNGFPHYDLSTLRFFGVLQHIAACYFLAAILFLTTSLRVQAVIFVGLLIGYWLIMTWVPVPGYGVGNLTPDGNLAAYIDRSLLAGHLYHETYDPEGILSTIPALATTLLGNLTGGWLLSKYRPPIKVLGMVVAATAALALGWIWSFWFPINKNLWTSSFVLWTGGLALYLLALCYWIIEIVDWRRWCKPFEIFGINALAAYVLHIMLLKIQNRIPMTLLNGTTGNLRLYITEHLFAWTTLPNASLLYAVSYVLLWLLVLGTLYHFRIFIKV